MIEILDKTACCGCSSCAEKCPRQCIRLKEDDEGFLYPQVDREACIDCGICEKVCPVLNPSDGRVPLHVYAAKNRNEEIRLKSSSGGIFTLFAEETIREGGVVFGARFDENWEVRHDYTETVEGLAAFRGSKYVQSRMEDSYRKAEAFLKQGRKVLFSGTPCQLAGLRKFLRKEYENLLAVDFICHGVPSPKVWRMYLDETIARQGVGKNTVLSHPIDRKKFIRSIEFRSKSTGWKKYSFALTLSEATAVGEKNSVLLSSVFSRNAYMRAFLSNLILRPSCYRCAAKEGKSGSDITVADYWGVQHLMPEFDDDKGVGLVFINSPKGEKAYSVFGNAESRETGYEEAQRYNGGLKAVLAIPSRRADFFRAVDQGKSVIATTERILHVSLFRRVLRKVKRIAKKVMSFKAHS